MPNQLTHIPETWENAGWLLSTSRCDLERADIEIHQLKYQFDAPLLEYGSVSQRSKSSLRRTDDSGWIPEYRHVDTDMTHFYREAGRASDFEPGRYPMLDVTLSPANAKRAGRGTW